MEFTEVVSAHVALPVIGVLLCAFLVFAFGFKSPVQPPSFDFDDERKQNQRRGKKTKLKSPTNGHAVALVEESAVKPSPKATKLTTLKTKQNESKASKEDTSVPKLVEGKRDKARKVAKEDKKEGKASAKVKIVTEDEGDWQKPRNRKDKKVKSKKEDKTQDKDGTDKEDNIERITSSSGREASSSPAKERASKDDVDKIAPVDREVMSTAQINKGHVENTEITDKIQTSSAYKASHLPVKEIKPSASIDKQAKHEVKEIKPTASVDKQAKLEVKEIKPTASVDKQARLEVKEIKPTASVDKQAKLEVKEIKPTASVDKQAKLEVREIKPTASVDKQAKLEVKDNKPSSKRDKQTKPENKEAKQAGGLDKQTKPENKEAKQTGGLDKQTKPENKEAKQAGGLDKQTKPENKEAKQVINMDKQMKPDEREDTESKSDGDLKIKKKKKQSKTKQTETKVDSILSNKSNIAEEKTMPLTKVRDSTKKESAGATGEIIPQQSDTLKVERTEEFEIAQKKKSKKKKEKNIVLQSNDNDVKLPTITSASLSSSDPTNDKKQLKEETTLKSEPVTSPNTKGTEIKNKIGKEVEMKPSNSSKESLISDTKRQTQKDRADTSKPVALESSASPQIPKSEEPVKSGVFFDELGGSSDSWTEAPKSKKKRPRREN